MGQAALVFCTASHVPVRGGRGGGGKGAPCLGFSPLCRSHR